MPQVIENEDGTRTFSINSGELRFVREMLDEFIPGFKWVKDMTHVPEVRATLDFVKSILA